jgi:hypothetical protein
MFRPLKGRVCSKQQHKNGNSLNRRLFSFWGGGIFVVSWGDLYYCTILGK